MIEKVVRYAIVTPVETIKQLKSRMVTSSKEKMQDKVKQDLKQTK